MPTPRRTLFTHAVIMGDLVGSEHAGSIAALHRAFYNAINQANKRHQTTLASPLTITLGDEFQGLARTLVSGLAIVRALRTAMLQQEAPCRFVLGLARIETPLNAKRAWNMMGPGLAAAREKLADKRHSNAYRFSLPKDRTTEVLLDSLGFGLSEIERSWTARQREVVHLASDDERTGAEIAADLKVARRTYYKIRQAARLELYEHHWDAIKTATDDLDRRYKLA